ncbi:SDR family NAD(P)-dependent oxidoreductase, partial [Pseudomonas carnis]|uniref:SDR family NAD(P)-dependent oxidoreductase n=1 Tax=Pseudomonas carnis TaxID=2487355 RepID=UPI001F2E8415
MEFQDKNIVITGGASGIGLAVAKQLAKAGARLFLMSRNQQKADAALEILRASAQFLFCDVASHTSV